MPEQCAFPDCKKVLDEGDAEYCLKHQDDIDDAMMAHPAFLSAEADDPKEDDDEQQS